MDASMGLGVVFIFGGLAIIMFMAAGIFMLVKSIKIIRKELSEQAAVVEDAAESSAQEGEEDV